jgi:hypothetical protein
MRRRDCDIARTWPSGLEVQPKRKPNLMMEADTAIGLRERKPRKRKDAIDTCRVTSAVWQPSGQDRSRARCRGTSVRLYTKSVLSS